MITRKYSLLGLLVVVMVPLISLGQDVLRIPPYTGPGTFLNQYLIADTVANNGIPANRVYELQRGGLYLCNATFQVNAGWTCRIRANDSVGVPRPIIFLYPTGTGSSPQNPPGRFIDLRGNLEMTNIVLSGYFEPIDTNLNNLQGALITVPTSGAGANIAIDNCVLTNSNGNHVRTDGAPGKISFTNDIFANMGYLGRSNLGAGKGLDIRAVSVDSLIIVNNTFVNFQDRIVRHLDLSGGLTGAVNYTRIDHNTFVNGMSYHGFLVLGTVGPNVTITNNLMLDHFSLGNDTDAVRQLEFAQTQEVDAYGGPRMVWVQTSPNDSATTYHISNNFYAVSDSGQAFFDQFASAGVTGEGSPLTYHINSKLGADSSTAFVKLNGFTFGNVPMVMVKMNRWYRDPNGGNKSKNTPGPTWNNSDDFDRRGEKYFTDTLDCSYATGSPAYTGATFAYPAGDLNWFPSQKALWESDPRVDVKENGSLPVRFTLAQNYPNPFNPATRIAFTLAKATNVKLEVFDLLGRRVATLIDESRTAGEYTVDFNASRLTSGVYFYRLTTPDQTLSKKMMLLK
jgi:hypothetical protein